MRSLIIAIVVVFWREALNANGSADKLLVRSGSISFQNADIIVSMKTPNGEKIAEAFNATSGVRDPRKMRWVSLGLPRLLVRKDNMNNSKVIYFKQLFDINSFKFLL